MHKPDKNNLFLKMLYTSPEKLSVYFDGEVVKLDGSLCFHGICFVMDAPLCTFATSPLYISSVDNSSCIVLRSK